MNQERKDKASEQPQHPVMLHSFPQEEKQYGNGMHQ
jgi:hypothetical protein